jgi:hypothetical protein
MDAHGHLQLTSQCHVNHVGARRNRRSDMDLRHAVQHVNVRCLLDGRKFRISSRRAADGGSDGGTGGDLANLTVGTLHRRLAEQTNHAARTFALLLSGPKSAPDHQRPLYSNELVADFAYVSSTTGKASVLVEMHPFHGLRGELPPSLSAARPQLSTASPFRAEGSASDEERSVHRADYSDHHHPPASADSEATAPTRSESAQSAEHHRYAVDLGWARRQHQLSPSRHPESDSHRVPLQTLDDDDDRAGDDRHRIPQVPSVTPGRDTAAKKDSSALPSRRKAPGASLEGPPVSPGASTEVGGPTDGSQRSFYSKRTAAPPPRTTRLPPDRARCKFRYSPLQPRRGHVEGND